MGNDEPGSQDGSDGGGKLQRMPQQQRAQSPPLPPLINTEPRHHDAGIGIRCKSEPDAASGVTGRRACT